MKLVLIFGDAAVGKMTVGQELEKITDLTLFHNHMSIEPVIQLFGSYNKEAINGIREVIFKCFAKSDNYGMIFTFMWALDMKEDWDSVKGVVDLFESQNAKVYYVELYTTMEIRLERNKSENRLKNKPSKRDLEKSEERLLKNSAEHRFISYDGEIPFINYIKIDNSNLSAKDTAKIIKEKFNL